VDVRLLISGKSDHPYLVEVGRSYYEDLLEYGVRIYEYNKALHHAKVMTIDGRWMMVGSANCDNRSMRLNFELNIVAQHFEATVELEKVLLEDFEMSQEISIEKFRKRPFMQRLGEAAVRPLAPLL
jgi:cardiolipin synthase A/B